MHFWRLGTVLFYCHLMTAVEDTFVDGVSVLFWDQCILQLGGITLIRESYLTSVEKPSYSKGLWAWFPQVVRTVSSVRIWSLSYCDTSGGWLRIPKALKVPEASDGLFGLSRWWMLGMKISTSWTWECYITRLKQIPMKRWYSCCFRWNPPVISRLDAHHFDSQVQSIANTLGGVQKIPPSRKDVDVRDASY